MFKYFLDTRPYLLFISAQLAFSYLFILLYFSYELKYSLLIASSLIGTSLFSFLWILAKYKKNFLFLINEVQEKQFNEKRESFRMRFIGEKDVSLLFDKIDFAKNLVRTRFSGSVFEDRLNSLIEDSLEKFVANMEIIHDMKKAMNFNEKSFDPSKKEDYEKEIKEMYSSNSQIIENIELLVKDMLSERKEENNSEDINQRFKESFALYEKIKGAKV